MDDFNKNLNGFHIENGVLVSHAAIATFRDFQKNYYEVREKEKRVLSIAEILKLPYVEPTSTDYSLWKTRRYNINRFLKYLSKKKKRLQILDIGCGNGFFTNLMYAQGHSLMGLDVNLVELRQAAEAFGSSTITWVYADIFSDDLPEKKFDMITLCSSFHYFEHPTQLLRRCKELLHPDGEIHLIDSPFYRETEIEMAKKRSMNYFRSIGTENMHKYYHHNSYKVFDGFDIIFKYKPNKLRIRIFQDSPFPWILIQ
jgi:2-polyprenyl-3-methyl-5-hydroxy-6-metoxy-1,4-benzoquinol methylase